MYFRVIDTETCGLEGGIVEIASIDVMDGALSNPMSDLVSPGQSVSMPWSFTISRKKW